MASRGRAGKRNSSLAKKPAPGYWFHRFPSLIELASGILFHHAHTQLLLPMQSRPPPNAIWGSSVRWTAPIPLRRSFVPGCASYHSMWFFCNLRAESRPRKKGGASISAFWHGRIAKGWGPRYSNSAKASISKGGKTRTSTGELGPAPYR